MMLDLDRFEIGAEATEGDHHTQQEHLVVDALENMVEARLDE